MRDNPTVISDFDFHSVFVTEGKVVGSLAVGQLPKSGFSDSGHGINGGRFAFLI